MNVIGHGIDLVEIADLQRWIDDPRNPLLSRCFTKTELESIGDGPNRVERLAGRFAAKEAVMKALGTGFGAGIAFTDIQIRRSEGEPPMVFLSGGAAQAAANLGVQRWQLSISHTTTTAIASAIALGVTPEDGKVL